MSSIKNILWYFALKKLRMYSFKPFSSKFVQLPNWEGKFKCVTKVSV